MSPLEPLSPTFIQQLLEAHDRGEQMALLRAEKLFDEAGLLHVLEEANRLAGNDPEKTRSLAILCRGIADAATAPLAVPRADYLEAYVHAMRGNFERARSLLESARDGYMALNSVEDALSVNVGLSTIYGETGDFSNAIAACKKVLELQKEPPDDSLSKGQQTLIAKASQNLGIFYERQGQYKEALSAYATAEEHYQQLTLRAAQADILMNRGLVLQHLGHIQDALHAFSAAEAIYRTDSLPLFRARALINIGETHLITSNYTQSIAAFEESRKLLEELDELSDYAILLRHLGDAYLALNLHGEALDSYQKAIRQLELSGLRHHHAHAAWGLGVTLVSHRPDEAVTALTTAAELFHAMGNQRLLSAVQLEQSTLLEQQGQLDQARALAGKALSAVQATNWRIQQIYALMRNADLAESPELAESFLRQAGEFATSLQIPQVHYRLDARFGRVLFQQQKLDEAQSYLERAVAEIQQLRSTLVQERIRASFLADKMSAFESLIRIHLGREDWQQAFAVAEQSRSRALVDLLSDAIDSQMQEGADAADGRSVGDPGLYDQLQRLRAELDSIYNRLLRGSTEDPDDGGQTRGIDPQLLSARAIEIERSISRLQLQRQQPSRAISDFVTHSSTAAQQTPSALAHPLLIYHIVGDEIIAFVQNRGDMQVVRDLCKVDDIEQLLQRLLAQWERFRVGQTFTERHIVALERSAQRILYELHRHLLEPLMPLLDTTFHNTPFPKRALDDPPIGRALTIVPHGLLHQLPFHALYDGERYLVDDFAISYAPSTTVFSICCQRHRPAGAVLLMGVADENIPAAEREVASIAQQLQRSGVAVDALCADSATRSALVQGASTCSILHIAAHGLFRSDNPLFSALKLHDGWLTAADALGLRLNQALVVLSACESGRSQIIGGDEIIGLTYGMLSAGASTLLVSQWLAQDVTTALLMEHWYLLLESADDMANALRHAQLMVKEDHPHPYHWAPFVLIGQRKNVPPAKV